MSRLISHLSTAEGIRITLLAYQLPAGLLCHLHCLFQAFGLSYLSLRHRQSQIDGSSGNIQPHHAACLHCFDFVLFAAVLS
eukprot:scaffold80931_cov73-Cyclotella_meneghiniana.AAC.5